MKKKKKKRIKIFPILLLIIILIIPMIYLTNNNKLNKLGYSKKAIEIINKLDKNTLNEIATKENKDLIEELILNNNFKIENLKNYIDFKVQNDSSVIETIKIVNNTYASNSDSTEVKNFKNSKYYIANNLERYLEYMNNYPDLDTKTVISYVNSNLDYNYYTNVKKADLSKDNLVIVNKYYKLDSDYVPEDLVLIDDEYNGNNKYIKKDAYEAYKELFNAAKSNGLSLNVSSAYRSYEYQQGLYNNYVARDGFDAAETYSARPGYSEHQTGLAIDFSSTKRPGLGEFEYTDEFFWMKNNAYKYGWILRYGEDKVKITGYMYESWHYRYVGKEVAKIIHDNDLTYEEYYAYYIKK